MVMFGSLGLLQEIGVLPGIREMIGARTGCAAHDYVGGRNDAGRHRRGLSPNAAIGLT